MASRASESAPVRPPILCLVVDRAVARVELARAVAEAVRGGVDWVQVRERELEGEALLELTESLIAAAQEGAAARSERVRVLVNRRCDVALAARADGVHLGFDAVDPESARRLLPAGSLIGVSAHAAPELRAAVGRADYAFLAPVFAPLSKAATRPPLGLDGFRGSAELGIPVLAQGGVDAERASALRRAGAAGVAVTGAILMSPDPGAAAAELRRALDA